MDVPGAVLVFAAALAQAVSNGLLSRNLSGPESLLFSFLSFGIATLVFLTVAGVRGDGSGRGPGSPAGAFRPLALLNLATAVTFLGFYWSLSLVPAPLAVAVETGVGPLAVTCLRYRSLRAAQRPGALVMGVLALVLALLTAVRMVSDGRPGPLHTQLTGLAVAAVAGTSAATVPILSRRLGALGVSPVRVTAHRFHLTYATALMLLAVEGVPSTTLHNGSRLSFLLLVAALGTALPLFVLQVGMHRTAPLRVALIVSSVPGMTYLTAGAVGRQGFDRIAFVLTSGSLALAYLGPRAAGALKRGRRAEVSA